ncbi:MAG: DUF2207 domain-containing protein [Oscillospiraceae bacterium]|jgi:uncharacterized membrane protein|nr:DUF2207 domain-containing protein [Oscillospiraceae bacterium]MCI2035652.1 DUF2207 domain-containing protein [Oscillospiraceae bacterium]
MRKRTGTGLKFFRLLLAVTVILGCTAILGGWTSGYAGGSKQVMENLSVDASLVENGDMKVREVWKIGLQDRGKAYRNFYRTFELDPSKADGITNLAVYDEDRKLQYAYAGDIDPETAVDDEYKNQCYLHNTQGKTEIGWFMPGMDEGVRAFSVTYTIKNVVHRYSDTAELYYKFVPDDFGIPIANMQGTVNLPSKADKSGLRAWLHTDAPNSNIQIDSEKQIRFTAGEIPKNTYVEVRMLMPVELFPSSTRKSGEAVFSSIQSAELQQAEAQKQRMQEEERRQYILGIVDAVAAPVILVICIVILIAVKRKNRRIKVDVPEYTREIPLGNSPAGIANLFYFYHGIDAKEKERIFSATMLSLAQKGYLRFSGKGRDIAVNITGNTKNLELTASERIFYEIVSTVAETYDSSFTMAQFKKYGRTHYHYLDRKIEEFWTASRREIVGRGYYRRKPLSLGVLTAVGVLLAVLAFVVFLATGSADSLLVFTPCALLAGGALLIVAGRTKVKLSAKGESDLEIWHGLQKYMLEFSRMKEYGIPELTLWEQYLVYATMMGISREVCKQLKLVYPQLGDTSYWDSNPVYSYLPYMMWANYGGFGMRGADFDFGSALGSTLGDISSAATRLAHPPVSGNGGFGGGGFGGGGFGGGGGGVR